MSITLSTLLVSFSSAAGQSTSRPADCPHPAPLIEKALFAGEIAKAESLTEKAMAVDKSNDNLRFQLGVVQVLRGVERFSQSLSSYGLRDHGRLVPFLRLPMEPNPNPRPISYEDARRITETLLSDLMKAEETLAPIRDESVHLPLHPGLIRMDLNGDGRAEESETFWRVFEAYVGMGLSAEDAEGFVICFDRADVAWLRGYCHLMSAVCEIILAHDFQDLFERTGKLFFVRIKTPHKCVASSDYGAGPFMWPEVADAISFIHLLNLRVSEPARMQSALKHLESMVKLSRETWEWVCKEKDGDHEWLPNPMNRQTSVIAGISLSREQLRTWNTFLDHVSDLLAGKALLPHWRLPGGEGINLRRVFTEPQTFDLILWIQGTAATPYVEKGRVLGSEIWQQLDAAFQGGFVRHAIWFN